MVMWDSLLQFSGLALPAAEQGGAEGLEVKECRDAALATDWLVESKQTNKQQTTLAFQEYTTLVISTDPYPRSRTDELLLGTHRRPWSTGVGCWPSAGFYILLSSSCFVFRLSPGCVRGITKGGRLKTKSWEEAMSTACKMLRYLGLFSSSEKRGEEQLFPQSYCNN